MGLGPVVSRPFARYSLKFLYIFFKFLYMQSSESNHFLCPFLYLLEQPTQKMFEGFNL